MDIYIKNLGLHIKLYKNKIIYKILKKVLDFLLICLYTNKSVEKHEQNIWDLSSAGRASALQAEGHRFEPCRSHIYGGIAQLARAHGSYPWCRGFKSPSRYFLFRTLSSFFFAFLYIDS